MGRPYPRLIHPVPVQIEQIDHGATVYDDDAREPVQQAARKAVVTLPGQASYGSRADLRYSAGGPQEGEDGFITFRMLDLQARSVTLQVNDRILKVGAVNHDAYITRIQPMGHYPEFNSSLVRAYFADRQPAKHQRRTA
jgi:hypothetical protein